MKIKYYKNADEIVYEEEALKYAMEKLGLEMTPKDKCCTKKLEQLDFEEMLVKWYFSTWVKRWEDVD